MMHHTILRFALLFAVAGVLLVPSQVRAQAMADYTATPPFISETATPNILLLLDNSGSMNQMAFPTGTVAFNALDTYTGFFDPAECYQYLGGLSNRFVPDPAANPSPMPAGGWTCAGNATYEWSGNLLNYATMRKIDIAKYVMVGGMCATARAADLTCPRTKAQDLPFTACCRNQTQSIPKAAATDRMPASILAGISGLGGRVYFHLRGSDGTLRGKVCIDNDSTAPGGSSCGDGDGYAETTARIMADQLTNTTGVIQQVGTKARFGLMDFDASTSEGGRVTATVGSALSAMVTAVENTRPETWTPLGESLYDAVRYYAQVPSTYDPAHYPTGVNATDPYYFAAPQWASTDQFVDCCESFVILFTDGEPTQDLNIPASLQDVAHAVHGAHCTGVGCNGHRTDYPSSGSHYLDDVAYWGHTNDLRQGTLPVIGGGGNDLPGTQNVTVYSFYAFGNLTGREILHSTAKAGAFDDKNGNGVPDNTGQTCTYQAGSPFGTGTSTSSAEWDADKDCVADAYFESADANDMRDRLMAAITSILQRSSAGSAASVLASSSTGEGALYQSFFFPSTFEGVNEINWTGYTQGLFIDSFGNLREDTVSDDKLVLKQDYIVQSRFDSGTNQVVLDRFVDADEDGQPDTPGTPVSTVGLRQVKSVWEAGSRLALTASTSRRILTWVDKNGNGLVDGGEQLEFTTANAADLSPYLRAGAAPYTTNNIINFIRGDQIAGMRDRQLTVGGSLNVWKLGDSIHAQPVVVAAPAQRYDVIYGDSSYTAFFAQYKDRRRVVYVGGNDGMLHAFNGGYYHRGDDPSTPPATAVEHGWFTRTPTNNSSGPLLGDELWGFVPQELLPHLRWLTDPSYTHVYYVDLKPKVTDVRIFTPDADHPNGWGTILMGGFRMGGSCGNCAAGTGAPPMQVTADFDYNAGTADTTRTFYSAYFVLDITNPENDPVLLWSYSSSDLGLTTTVPSMLRVSLSTSSLSDNTTAKWYMIFGSGPTGYDGDAGQTSNLYAVDLAQGPGASNSLVTTLPVGTWNSFMADTLTIDRNFDYRVDVSYMGRVIHDGTLPWRGKLYRLTMNTCAATPCSTSIWGINDGGGNRIPTEILDTYVDALGATNELGPISASPAVAIDDSNKVWVFAGTGRYFADSDKTNTDQQYFVGVKDSVMNGACTEITRTSCHDSNLVDVSTAEVCLLGIGDCGTGTNQVTGVTGATNFPSLINLVASKDGWVTTLPASGERSLSRPLVFGGIVFFPTFTPANDICSSSGQSNLYALYYMTGSAYSSPVVGTTPSGSNKLVNRTTGLGQGLATEAVAHIGTGSGHGKFKIICQNSLGQLCGAEGDNLAEAVVSRFVSWYSQRD